jgi:hypothetical protein
MNNRQALELLIKHAIEGSEKVDIDDLQAAVLLTQSWLKQDATVKVEGLTLNLKSE